MRRLRLLAAMCMVIVLAACQDKELEYDDLSDHLVTTYFAAEHASHNRYLIYYFDSTENASDTLKQEVITFFDTFEALEFVLLDTASVGSEQSLFGGYLDAPVLHVVSEGDVLDTRNGFEEIRSFLREYESLTFDYTLFANQHIHDIQDVYQTDQGDVLVYYYDPEDPICEAFLRWAFTKPAQRIRFADASALGELSTFPLELYRLQEGTPSLFLMSGDRYANEMIQGDAAIVSYIEAIGSDPIVAQWRNLDYTMFRDHARTDYTNVLELGDGPYFVYFYSIYCSHCNAIKSDVLAFFVDQEDHSWYLVDLSSATGTMPIADFVGVPALYVVQDGVVIASYIGSRDIPNFLSHYRQGTITFD